MFSAANRMNQLISLSRKVGWPLVLRPLFYVGGTTLQVTKLGNMTIEWHDHRMMRWRKVCMTPEGTMYR